MNPTLRLFGFHFGFATLYAAAVIFSDMLISQGNFSITPIWPPAGVGFACLLLGGIRAWPTILVGILAGIYFGDERPLTFWAFSIMANILGPIVAVLVLRKFWARNLISIRLRNGFALLGGGAVLSAIAAIFGITGSWLTGTAPAALPAIALQWFLGDLFGVIVCTPAILSVGRAIRYPNFLANDPAFYRFREKMLWGVGIFISAFIWVWLSEKSPDYALAITFLPLIFLGWTALRFDHLFTSVSVMAITLTIVTFIGLGLAGFTAPETMLDASILLFFVTVIGILPLLVSAAAHQNRYLAEQLEYRANHDHLTGLSNRLGFEDRSQGLISAARNHGQRGALCYLDLDNFKVVNDTCGHVAGDELLKQIAHVLQSNMDREDHIARLGGDEFGLLFRNCNAEVAAQKARRLVDLIDEFRFVWRRHIFAFSASCGLVPIHRNVESFARVMSDADAACFEAKEQGGNRVIVSSSLESSAANNSPMQWAVRITEALERNRFSLYAQKIACLANDSDAEKLHFEVLLRMRDDSGRTLLPNIFIPAAERFKMMPKVDRWVIKSVLRTLERHHRMLDNIDTVAINLSGPSISDSQFVDMIVDLLESSSVPTSKICFEITETSAIGDLGHATRFMERFRELGCRFALDDFGSGLSSFGYLKALQVDYLKIDGSFVRDLLENRVDQAMVRSINEVGHVLGKQTIAEYVETADIADLLREMGVDFGQGHAFGKPIALEKFLRQANEQRDQALDSGSRSA